MADVKVFWRHVGEWLDGVWCWIWKHATDGFSHMGAFNGTVWIGIFLLVIFVSMQVLKGYGSRSNY